MALKYLEVGQIRTNKQGQEYEIISKDDFRCVVVRFLKNGYTKETMADYAYRGVVRMPRILVGEVYPDKNGELFTITEVKLASKIKIVWPDGEERYTTTYKIENKEVIRERNNIHINPAIKVGQIYKNTQGSEIVVIGYENSTKVLVEIGKTKYKEYVASGNLLKGFVHDKYAPSVAGKGIIGDAENIDVKSQVYVAWVGMVKRCYTFYDYNPRAKINYGDCSVREDFLYFPNFIAWYDKQVVQPKWHLDKDLLVPGNRVYSPDTCIFLPRALNTFLTVRKNERGPYPLGVTIHEETGHYEAACNRDGKRIYLGVYKTPEAAFAAYKVEKEAYAKDLAERWKDQIDPRAYEALMKYEVNITD